MKISLVIPVRNEARTISRLLVSIAAQARQPDEVIFVDAGSADETRHLIEERENDRLAMKTVSIGPAYPGTARNSGVEEALYDAIAFTDGGIELDGKWLKELSLAMENDPSIDVVYGSYSPRTDTLFKECLAIAIVPPAKKRASFIASSLLKKAVWRDVGGFPDFRAAEDRIFMSRVKEKGFKVIYNPNACVVWDIPGNLPEVFKRFYTYSYHDLRAARGRDWHFPVLRMYSVAMVSITLGAIFWPPLVLLPVAGFALRIARKIYANREEAFFVRNNSPLYFLVGGFLIFFIDVAMFAGWGRYMIAGRRRDEDREG